VLITDLTTPALLVERDVLDANLATMSAALPGPRPPGSARTSSSPTRCSTPAGSAPWWRTERG
jgi:hypothetical protein